MNDSNDAIGAASLFNSYVADWGNRVNSLVNYMIVVSGGILAITVGAFLNGKAVALPNAAIPPLKHAWVLLSLGVVLALSTSFLHVVSQAVTISRWRGYAPRARSPRMSVVTGPLWLRAVIWVVFVAAFVCCAAGFVTISLAAGQLLRPHF